MHKPTFELNRLTTYSDDEIIREIQRVAAILNVRPLTGAAFDATARVSKGTVIRRFGGWENALQAAGLAHLYSGQSVTDNMRGTPNRHVTDDELLTELRRVSEIVGRKDISTGDILAHGKIHRGTYARRFGSLKHAIQLAGLETRQLGAARRVHTDAALFENLLVVWTHVGRQPHYSEMNSPPSMLKSKNYINRFGTWRRALMAFIAFMDRDSHEHVYHPVPTDTPSASQTISKRPDNACQESRREIPLGLRFKVMHRDHFKCVLCGDNPPAHPGLILHVDHIIPWSKGGKTRLDNLRTLCAPCNIGRGNRYSE